MINATLFIRYRILAVLALTLTFFCIPISSRIITSAAIVEGSVGQAASLTISPITWGTIGLDSNKVSDGPNNFPVGARVCNIGNQTALNLQSSFVWDSANALISLRPGSASNLTGSALAAGECRDLYYEIEVTRSNAAYNTTRRFHITATADGLGIVGTPTPREIFVEKLVSQNRNSVVGIKLNGGDIPFGGTMNLQVGNTYTIELIASTATNGYEQIESFINLPNVIFQTLSVSSTYTAPSGYAGNKLYEDACGWNPLPTDANYRSCIGPTNVTGGKAGGQVTILYTVKVLSGSGTSQTLNTLIYDFSGSSYHYNSDFSTTTVIAAISSPAPSPTPTPTPCPQVTVSPVILSNGVEGFAYQQSLSAAPAGVYTYSVSSGGLPTGLTLNPGTGVISGTPTVTGNFSFTIQALGQSGCSGTQAYNVVIASSAAMCVQQFDEVGAPSLPQGWTSGSNGSLANWVTSTSNPQTPMNSAFVAGSATVGNSEIKTPAYAVASTGGQMRFNVAFNFEDEGSGSPIGHDGMVLEISINGGPFEDILSAGGSFVTGGYNKTISSAFGSPIGGRPAWSGLSGGTSVAPAYVTVTVNLPVWARGQLVRMKWVVATDEGLTAPGDSGARLDSIVGTECATTSGRVSLSGRILDPEGRGLNGAVVRISNDQGRSWLTRTSTLGYYRFDELDPGRTYIVDVKSRRNTFNPRVIQLFDSVADFNFF